MNWAPSTLLTAGTAPSACWLVFHCFICSMDGPSFAIILVVSAKGTSSLPVGIQHRDHQGLSPWDEGPRRGGTPQCHGHPPGRAIAAWALFLGPHMETVSSLSGAAGGAH